MPEAPSLQSTGEGYEYIRCRAGGSDETVYIHRLLYVSEYGFDALPPEFEVHHRTSIPWLNVPGNLVAVDPAVHSRYHLHDEVSSLSP